MAYRYTATLVPTRLTAAGSRVYRRIDGPAFYRLAVQLQRRGRRWRHPGAYLVRTVALAEALATYAAA